MIFLTARLHLDLNTLNVFHAEPSLPFKVLKREADSSAAGRLVLVHEGNIRSKNQALVLMSIPWRVRPSWPDPNKGKTREIGSIYLSTCEDNMCAQASLPGDTEAYWLRTYNNVESGSRRFYFKLPPLR